MISSRDFAELLAYRQRYGTWDLEGWRQTAKICDHVVRSINSGNKPVSVEQLLPDYHPDTPERRQAQMDAAKPR